MFRNFWQSFQIDWNLASKIAILTGSNGSGKSTILSILSSILLEGRLTEDLSKKVSKVVIEFDDGTKLTNINFRDSYKSLVREAAKDSDFVGLVEDINTDIGNNTNKLKRVRIEASFTNAMKDGTVIPLQTVLDELHIETLKTFDTLLPSEEYLSRKKSLYDKGVKTNLDLQLYHLQESYAYYLANLARKVERKFINDNFEDLTPEFVKKLYEKKNLFIRTINNHFKESGKEIDTEDSVLKFKLIRDKKEITVFDLSSGEKQLVFLLLTALLNEGKQPIILMDEPEMSLHIDWQETLLDDIQRINPECQLIIVTHSPSLLIRGWAPNVTYLDDIIERKRL